MVSVKKKKVEKYLWKYHISHLNFEWHCSIEIIGEMTHLLLFDAMLSLLNGQVAGFGSILSPHENPPKKAINLESRDSVGNSSCFVVRLVNE